MHKHGTPQHGMFSTQNGQGRASQMQLRVQTSVHGVVDEVRIKVCRCNPRVLGPPAPGCLPRFSSCAGVCVLPL